MTPTRKLTLTMCLGIALLLPGPALWGLYDSASDYFPSVVAGLFGQRFNISIVLATFSFTMLGFLAASITIIFALGHSQAFKRYQRGGYFSVFLGLYLITIASLMVTFGLSLFGFSQTGMPTVFRLSLMMAANNIFQLLAVSVIVVNLTRKAMRG